MNQSNNISESYFTTNSHTMQLRFNLNTEVYVKDNGKVLLVRNLLERMFLPELSTLYPSKGRKLSVDPRTMLQLLLFCYSEGCFSSRDIEDRCRYDLRLIYLLDGQKAPDHSTIHRFRKKLAPFFEGILEQFTLLLYEHGFLDLSSLYMDGTKMEAVSNKYSFVWRGSIEKFQSKLVEKIRMELNLPEEVHLQETQNP